MRCFFSILLLFYIVFFLDLMFSSKLKIYHHFSTFFITYMTNILQKMAKWLWMWNSPSEVKNMSKFLLALLFTGNYYDEWFNKVFCMGLYKTTFFIFFLVIFFCYLSILNIIFSYHNWRRVYRLNLHHLEMIVPLTSIRFLWRIFCNPSIMLSIGGSFLRYKVC